MSMKALLLAATAVLLCTGLCGCDSAAQGNAQATRRLHTAGDQYDRAARYLISQPAYTHLQGVDICVKQQLTAAACAGFRRRNTEQKQQLFNDVDRMINDRTVLGHLDPRRADAVTAATRYRDDAKRFYDDTVRYYRFIVASAGEEASSPT